MSKARVTLERCLFAAALRSVSECACVRAGGRARARANRLSDVSNRLTGVGQHCNMPAVTRGCLPAVGMGHDVVDVPTVTPGWSNVKDQSRELNLRRGFPSSNTCFL